MPILSHQMSEVGAKGASTLLLPLSVLGVFLCGCTELHVRNGGEFSPVYIPDSSAVPRAVVVGSLKNLLPDYDETSAVERFLYGPNSAGRLAVRNPQGMARLGNRILVCDQGYPDLVSIDLATGKCEFWGDHDHKPRCPVDVTVSDDGRVYVADTTLGSVLEYGVDEKLLSVLSRGQEGNGAFRPCAVCVRHDTLYIGNIGARCVERFDLTSRRWLEAFVPPEGSRPVVAPTGICAGPEDIVFVADAVQGLVHRVSVDGQWLEPIGRPGRSAGQFVRPKQVCCTSSGLLLVSDAGRQSVLVFDKSGKWLFEIASDGPGWEGFTLPMGVIALDASELSNRDEYPPSVKALTADDWIIVSDSLGGMPLTLLGVVVRERRIGSEQD